MMISLSGIDCCGKSTQIETLRGRLDTMGRSSCVVWSRGGYTPGIELIKKIISPNRTKDKTEMIRHSEEVCADRTKSLLLLIASILDLWLYYGITMRFKQRFGRVVICDRYIWDTYIDFKLKYPQHDFEYWSSWRLLLKLYAKPDVSIVMFISPEESMYRSTLKNEPFPETIDKRRKRIDMYFEEMKKGRWQHKINASASIEKVFDSIWSIIGPLLRR